MAFFKKYHSTAQTWSVDETKLKMTQFINFEIVNDIAKDKFKKVQKEEFNESATNQECEKNEFMLYVQS